MIRVICYDIVDDPRRQRVSRILAEYGHRRQRSVFELDVPDRVIDEVLRRVGMLIDVSQDRLSVYTLCKACEGRTQRPGLAPSKENTDGAIIV